MNKIVNGEVVPLSAEEVAEFCSMQADVQGAGQAARIKAERDRRRFEGGVLVGGLWFKSDAQAIGEYTAMAMLGAAMPGTVVLRAAWRTMQADVTVPMTPNLAKQILLAGFNTIAAIDDAAQVHLSALEASNDPATYDFSNGWPAAYEEAE